MVFSLESYFQKFLLQFIFIVNYIHGIIISTFGNFDLNDRHSSISQSVVDGAIRQNNHCKAPFPYFGCVVNYNKDEKRDNSNEICMVCLQELVDGDEVRNLMNCRHVFHKCCLDPWVELGRRVCPLCRSSLVEEEVDDGDYYESFQHLAWTSLSFIVEYSAYILQ
ncbi:hypothetical protein ZOSMA_409G00130 [Zostera marina]|uniref:RING-type domain-containing protein n=1 Tax=Zostera marina TaxID=29655 RepID=A0A0K9P5I6_ZOSMR|nr:hypothetical protein ZOSMA_409G00130 [Zostera marina]